MLLIENLDYEFLRATANTADLLFGSYDEPTHDELEASRVDETTSRKPAKENDNVALRPSRSAVKGFHEANWLESGDYRDCILRFVDKYYSDDEKRELWNARGDKARFNWHPGMRKPEPI